jgi:hypothetical protein
MTEYDKDRRPALGQPVWFAAQLERTYDPATGILSWYPVANDRTIGVYAGHRVKQVGKIVGGDWEAPSEWRRKGSIHCAIVFFHERRNPVYVPFESISSLSI